MESKGVSWLVKTQYIYISSQYGVNKAVTDIWSFFCLSILESLVMVDWKALRGAIVGCLSLLRRKSHVGVVTDNKVKAVAQSYLQNLQVQSLGQHDRKLCFQLMECILDRYPAAVRDLGDNLMYGICEAIDGEKDPQCLMLSFRIVEILSGLFPDPSGPLADFAEDLFEILGCYFPIHFTHPNDEDVDVKRDELSRALMLAFASTPLFAPFAIPLLLEKLSSSLPSAKVESFKYLSYCTSKYGADKMAKHFGTLWSSVKDATYVSPQSSLSTEAGFTSGMGFQDSDIMKQAFVLLQELVQQSNGSFISLILDDEDIKMFISSLNQYEDFDNIPIDIKQRLHAVGRIMSVCANTTIASCNKVFESFFPLLMNYLGLSVAKPSKDSYPAEDYYPPGRLNFGALYLCVELLTACRYLVGFDELTSIHDFSNQTWCVMLHNFSKSLATVFISLLGSNVAENSQNAYVCYGVKGLQNLATFPGSLLAVSKSTYDSILLKLMSVITSDINKTFAWTSAMNSLVEIGSFLDNCPDSERSSSFGSIVVEKIFSLISSDDLTMPLSLKLQAAFEIGATGKNFMLRVVQGLDEAISPNLSAVYAHGNLKSVELTVKLLECYSNKVLPWFHENGGSEEIPLNFALNIWDKIENSRSFNLGSLENELLDATMTAMKQAVGNCSEESQETIINKALGVLLSSNCFRWMESISGNTPLKAEGLQQIHKLDSFAIRDEWITSLIASVVIALRPQTYIPNGKLILQFFITTLLNGHVHVPSAQALGSLVNKLPLKITGTPLSKNFSLDEAVDMIFHSCIWTSCERGSSEIDLSSLRLCSLSTESVKIHAVIGLAWIGKGLIMRGHEKVKDITMTLLSCMISDGNTGSLPNLQHPSNVCNDEDMHHQLMKSAADAFHIIMSDSESCLNRRYHASIRPLYKQRFFNTMMPILSSLMLKSDSPSIRSMLCRAIVHVVSDTPLTAILSEAKKLIPLLLDCLSMMVKDILNKEIIYSVLLIISGILVDKNGQEAVAENAHSIVNQLIELTTYPHMMVIRETAVQCLVAMSELPHTRIYPLRTQVLQAMLKALDDPKWVVRQEAVRCRQAWASIASRSLHF
ncbi:ARM repeat superfamily protein [Forsythia ovata]|uniref:MMS19 nucleotide excision repair protein n=1 Tax=Forsythia ovata TaxID=205694 RepID=A0ABD1TU51_9LAMI